MGRLCAHVPCVSRDSFHTIHTKKFGRPGAKPGTCMLLVPTFYYMVPYLSDCGYDNMSLTLLFSSEEIVVALIQVVTSNQRQSGKRYFFRSAIMVIGHLSSTSRLARPIIPRHPKHCSSRPR